MKLLEVVGVTVAARLLVLELDFVCHRRHPPCGGNGVIVYALRTLLRNVKGPT